MQATVVLKADWREPLDALAACAHEDFSLGFLSGGGGPRGRWSYVLWDPVATVQARAADRDDPFAAMRDLLGPRAPTASDGPPFQGGIAGLLGYELGARVEPVGHLGHPDWDDAIYGLYVKLLAFDHERGEVLALGRGGEAAQARTRAEAALAFLKALPPRPLAKTGSLADGFNVITPGETYEASVAAVVSRIEAGEIFQANIARAWGGRLAAGVTPFDLAERLGATSPAPFAAYFKTPGGAVISNSPERFVQVRATDGGLEVESRPIKGTRPRGDTPARDAALKAELIACEKDRAENLMIVDLMRNDLSRVCPPGSVAVTELFTVESFTNVHHLVSAVTGRLDGRSAMDLIEASFPPGSITGAPKIQAIKVISDYEGPRGPYCGSIFWAGVDGACDSSVLIRTIGLIEDENGWRFEARAGAGIVADSDPHEERLETEAKIDAIKRAFLGQTR